MLLVKKVNLEACCSLAHTHSLHILHTFFLAKNNPVGHVKWPFCFFGAIYGGIVWDFCLLENNKYWFYFYFTQPQSNKYPGASSKFLSVSRRFDVNKLRIFGKSSDWLIAFCNPVLYKHNFKPINLVGQIKTADFFSHYFVCEIHQAIGEQNTDPKACLPFLILVYAYVFA